MSQANGIYSLISAVILSAAILAGWPGRLTRATRAYAEERGTKEILIKTPWGSLEAAEVADLSRLGLPVYPGAKYVKGENSGTVNLSFGIKGKPDIRILTGKFRTTDSLEKVSDFYKKNLGKAVTKYSEKTSEGTRVFEIRRKSLIKAVELKNVDGETEIHLAHVEGLEETN